MALVSALISRVDELVPGAPFPLITEKVNDALTEFCGTSECWLYDFDPMLSVATQLKYDLFLPTDAELARIINIRYNNSNDLTPSKARPIPAAGTPLYYTQMDHKSFELYPYPDTSDYVIQVTAALRPTTSATTFPDEIYSRYARHIAAGAVASFMAMPKRDWYDQRESLRYRTLFESGMYLAKAASERRFSKTDVTVIQRPLA